VSNGCACKLAPAPTPVPGSPTPVGGTCAPNPYGGCSGTCTNGLTCFGGKSPGRPSPSPCQCADPAGPTPAPVLANEKQSNYSSKLTCVSDASPRVIWSAILPKAVPCALHAVLGTKSQYLMVLNVMLVSKINAHRHQPQLHHHMHQPSLFQLHFQSGIHWMCEHATGCVSYTGVVQVSLFSNTRAALESGTMIMMSKAAVIYSTSS
jgi:hypothetical protein